MIQAGFPLENLDRASKSSIRLRLLATIAIIFSFGYVDLSPSQSALILTNPAPNLISQVDASAAYDIRPADKDANPLHRMDQTPIEPVREMLGQVDPERVLADLRRLTGVEPICTSDGCYTITNRETGREDLPSEGLEWAKDYVYETLVALGYSVEILDWSREGYADQNIIARKQGEIYPDQEIYFIAHLDGYLLNNPAADDDASGSVSLLELSRILSNRTLAYTVVIFFSTGEEHGSLGSRSFVEAYPERLGAIKYLVSVEMLGFDSNDDGKMELWNGDQPLDFVQRLAEIITAYRINLVPEIVSGCT